MAPFARHWYTGNRFLDENLHRFLDRKKRRSRHAFAELCSTRGWGPARPPKRENSDWQKGKRATTGRERGAPVREAWILGSTEWWWASGFLRARSGAGRGHRQAGKRPGRERDGAGKAGVLGRGVGCDAPVGRGSSSSSSLGADAGISRRGSGPRAERTLRESTRGARF